jgi:hypothetical protein
VATAVEKSQAEIKSQNQMSELNFYNLAIPKITVHKISKCGTVICPAD